MFRFLFDTDHLTLFDHIHVLVWQRFLQRPVGSVAISAVTVEEILRGRLAVLSRHQGGPQQVLAYSRLIGSLSLLGQFAIADFDQGERVPECASCPVEVEQVKRKRLG